MKASEDCQEGMQLVGNEGGGPGSVQLASAAGRWVLAVAVMGEAMVLLEATVVNVALPAIGRDLGVGVAGPQIGTILLLQFRRIFPQKRSLHPSAS